MLIILKFIILFGFVDLKAGINEAPDRLMNYCVHRQGFEDLCKEFKKFERYSDAAKNLKQNIWIK